MRVRPPYSHAYATQRGAAGLVIAMGPDAWAMAKTRKRFCPVLVLPCDKSPDDFIWPAEKSGALVHETGSPNDRRLNALARALLRAGNPYVVAIRHSLVNVKGADARIYFYPEVQNVAA